MFFFFAGGVEQQVKQVVKSGVGRCIACGSRADLVHYDKVLKLFFVPVWRWPADQPSLHCNNCNLFFPESLSPPQPPSPPRPTLPHSLTCRFCAREIEPDFRFCPFCGAAI